MKFLKLSPMQKFFATVGVTGVIIAVVALACVWTYRRTVILASELARLDIEIASQRKEQQQIGVLVALLQKHRADFDRLQSLSISRANPAPFFQKFETLAARTHTTIMIHLDNRDATSESMAFRFVIEGAQSNVADMLALIEHALYKLTIDGLSIEKVSNERMGAGGVSPGSGVGGSSMTRLTVGVHIKASP